MLQWHETLTSAGVIYGYTPLSDLTTTRTAISIDLTTGSVIGRQEFVICLYDINSRLPTFPLMISGC